MASQTSDRARGQARFDRGLAELERYLHDFEDAALPRARNFVRSGLEDAMERSHRRRDPEEWAERTEAERRKCAEMQDELRNSINPDRVPSGLRDLTPWAIRLGVGDDVCRNGLAEGLTPAERSALLRAIRKQATSIHVWLDAFGDKPMTPEAAAFMYLLLVVEEMNTVAP